MATQFTQDDFVPLDNLVQQLSNSCKATASVFEDLTQDLHAIHRLLEHLIKQATNAGSLLMKRCQDRRKDWLHILETLTYALCELQEHISTYYEVGPDIWFQADDAQRHFNDLRSEVMVGYDAVDTFVDSLGLSPAARKDYSLGQIEKLLVEAMREERLGMADYGVTRAARGGGFAWVQSYLRDGGIDEVEIQRHDARTKQLLIWVKQNEPALTEIMENERLAAEAERKARNSEGSSFPLEFERAPLNTFDQDESANTADVNAEEEREQSPIEYLAPEARRKSQNAEASKTLSKSEIAMQHIPLINLDRDQDTGNTTMKSKEAEVEEKAVSKDVESEEEYGDLQSTTVLVDRPRPSSSSRPSSIATSAPSLIEAEDESTGSDWELL